MPFLSKGIKELYIKLGADYSIRSAGSENIINRYIGLYELRICGIDHNRKTFSASVQVNHQSDNKIIESISDIYTVTELKCILNELITQYAKLSKHRDFMQYKI